MAHLLVLLSTLLALSIHQASSSILWIDCHPDKADSSSQQVCLSRGCTWNPKTVANAPWCEFSNSDNPKKMAGYEASGDQARLGGFGKTTDTYTAKLTRRPTPSVFGADYQKATFKAQQVTNEILKLTITDADGNAKKAKYPDWRTNAENLRGGKSTEVNDDSPLVFQTESSPFGFAVLRKSTGTPLVDTREIPGLTFAEQYVQISVRVPTQYVYGLGETTHDHFKHDFSYINWGFFSRDFPPGEDNHNLYGVHPFYLCLDDQDGNAHGVFFLNTHALNVALQPDPNNPQGGIITFRAIGGAIEMFVFAGPTPDDVIRQYISLIGLPQLPPYWALGFQISRYGYKTLSNVNEVFERNRQASIPQDTQVIDIDYMIQYMDFTVDPVTFANFSSWIQMLHDQQMKLVLIVDPAIASHPSIQYYPLIQGVQQNVFILDNRTGLPLEGNVWPGNTYFPDFTNPATTAYWTNIISDFFNRQGIKFDGLWIDMNEPSDFVVGSTSGCVNNKLNNPPYNPLVYDNINEKTICMDADQHAGKHYEYHNLYGHTEAEATYKALQSLFPGKRPFVLGRSTFPSSGKFTNHWLGDNKSVWQQIRQSIVGILEFNMFGIPLVGADICGFNGAATEELCVRWSQIGAFYPFSRNHNTAETSQDQDPAAWSLPAQAVIKKALNVRYGLLPHLYTLLYRAHTDGTPVIRALFYEFTKDVNTRTIDDQFLWGSGLLIAPALDPGTTQRMVYFPRGRWYDLVGHTEIPRPEVGRYLNIDMPLDSFGAYIRGGQVIPWQDPGQNTILARKNPLGILVALDENSQASGTLYWDDGESQDAPYSYVQFNASQDGNSTGIQITLIKNAAPIDPALNMIVIYGVPSKPASVKIDGTAVDQSSINYDDQTKAVTLDHLGIKLDGAHSLTWLYGCQL